MPKFSSSEVIGAFAAIGETRRKRRIRLEACPSQRAGERENVVCYYRSKRCEAGGNRPHASEQIRDRATHSCPADGGAHSRGQELLVAHVPQRRASLRAGTGHRWIIAHACPGVLLARMGESPDERDYSLRQTATSRCRIALEARFGRELTGVAVPSAPREAAEACEPELAQWITNLEAVAALESTAAAP